VHRQPRHLIVEGIRVAAAAENPIHDTVWEILKTHGIEPCATLVVIRRGIGGVFRSG
jgi:hypothetical protein